MFNPGAITHLLVKALDEAGVTFPTDKAEVIDKLGSIEIQTGDDTYVKASTLIEKMPVSEYVNGSAFMCAYIASTAL